MTDAAGEQRLLNILSLEQIEQNLYLGQNEHRGSRRLFGGQVLAQAASAAYRTVEQVDLHSLHAYFIRAGSAQRPVLYEVERIRDGRSFTTRRVVAVQNGEAIFNMDVSFQVAEPGFDHAHPMPNVPMADELNDDVSLARSLISTHKGSQLKTIAENPRPFETRSVFAVGSQAWGKDRFWSPTWIKFRQQLDPTNTKLARCLLAYASDMSVVSTASLPHQSVAARKDIQMASLDHALWIHRSVPINEWILFHKRTSTSQGARGLVHAEFFSQQGILIASVTQEGLLRTPAVPG